MIHADRSLPLKAFVDFVDRNNPHEWSADFCQKDPELYHACRDELLRCQNGMSAYTEIPLEKDGNIHIDHFRKKGISPFRRLMFIWNNLVVDERDNHDYGAGHKDDMVKSPEDYQLLINPVEPSPERYFSYLVNGRMVPAHGLGDEDIRKANYTISVFGLNHPTLVNMRHVVIDCVLAYIAAGFTGKEIRDSMFAKGFQTVVEYAISCLPR